jgi:osmotically-inducible protein OsmY
VNSPDQIQKAVAVARGVEGVQSVKNELNVKPQ